MLVEMYIDNISTKGHNSEVNSKCGVMYQTIFLHFAPIRNVLPDLSVTTLASIEFI